MRSFTALVNPISGGGVAPRRWRPIADRLAATGARVRTRRTDDGTHARALAIEAAAVGDVVVAVGGDGLAREAAAGVVAAQGILAIVPAGRGNDLARALDLPADPDRLAALLSHGEARAIDVLTIGESADTDELGKAGELGKSIVPGNVYAGVDSVSAAMINNGRWLPARLAYRLAPARALIGWRPPTYTITIDGESISTPAHLVVVANSGRYGHGLRIVPSAVLDDGLLDVLIVGASAKRKIVSFLAQAKHGTHIDRPEVVVRQGKRVTIDADRALPVGADGDDAGTLPCTVTIAPAALNVIAG